MANTIVCAPPVSPDQPATPKKYRTGKNETLNRQGRAMCRILHSQGMLATEIAKIVEASSWTVTKAIRNGYAKKDHVEDDHRFFDADADDLDLLADDDTDDEVTNSTFTATPPSRRTIPNPPPRRSGRRGVRGGRPQVFPTGTAERSGASSARRGAVATTTAASKRPVQDPSPLAKLNTNPREGHAVANDEVYAFLAGLRFDLSDWSNELRVKGMGTEQELFAMSGWGEERLDRILAKLVPKMPELHRYALTEGILDMAARGLEDC